MSILFIKEMKMTQKYRYHLWVIKEDMAALEQVAKHAGVSRAEWIRRVVSEAIRSAAVTLLAGGAK